MVWTPRKPTFSDDWENIGIQQGSPFSRQNTLGMVEKEVPQGSMMHARGDRADSAVLNQMKCADRTWCIMWVESRGDKTILQKVFWQSDYWTESDPYVILRGDSMEHCLHGQESSLES